MEAASGAVLCGGGLVLAVVGGLKGRVRTGVEQEEPMERSTRRVLDRVCGKGSRSAGKADTITTAELAARRPAAMRGS